MKKNTQASNGSEEPCLLAAVVPLFSLGQTVATRGALALLDHLGVSASALLRRHQIGDFGDMDEADRKANLYAISQGGRILSTHVLAHSGRIWIITEADRSVTTLLLPEEY